MTNVNIRVGLIGGDREFVKEALAALFLADSSGSNRRSELVAYSQIEEVCEPIVTGKFPAANRESQWQSVIENGVDAVIVGTWPDAHVAVATAAIQSGTHILVRPPFARTLSEIRMLVDLADRHPQVVSLIYPASRRFAEEYYILNCLQQGALGKITAVDVIYTTDENLQQDQVRPKECTDVMGRAILDIGPFTETLDAWVGPYKSLFAATTMPISKNGKIGDASGGKSRSTIPQIVMLSGLLESGAAGIEYHGGISTLSRPHDLVTIYGTQGTIRYNFVKGDITRAEFKGDFEPVELPLQSARQIDPTVEFLEAVGHAMDQKNRRPINNRPFSAAIGPMKKLEAIHLSAATGRAVELDAL